MEEALKNIVSLSTASQIVNLKTSAQQASEFLDLQQGLLRDPAHEIREKCFSVIQLCLESKRGKMVMLGLQMCHKMLKDDRFHSNFEDDDDSKWLLGQMLTATSSFQSHSEDIQVDILKLFLNVACSNIWTMNGRLVIAVLTLCSDAFESGNAAVRASAQASASQTLRSFINQLEEECPVEDVAPFSEVIPIIQFVCSRMDTSECTGRCEHGMLFLLECLLTIISTMPSRVRNNIHIQQILWQKVAPSLISVLGSPKVDKHITARVDGDASKGRGSGCLAATPTFLTIHARVVYSIINELVRLVGTIAPLRPMLESLFHRMLLYPGIAHRVDAIRSITELLRNPTRLLDVAWPMNTDHGLQSDLALIRLTMDSIDESRKGDSALVTAAVSCCCAILKALLELCDGHCVSTETAETFLQHLPELHSCEYRGPKCYQTITRLPMDYQDRIQRERERMKDTAGEDSDSSGIGQRSDCSGETEGPESLENEVIDSLLGEVEGKLVGGSLSLGIVDLPINLGDTERQHARHFVGALHDLLETLYPMWGSTKLDQTLQNFASQYCQGVIKDQPITEWGIIVNADGIYLTTLSALLLDLRLSKTGYYQSDDHPPLLTEDEFVEEVQGAGVLVYLSGTWLREVYQAVVGSSLLQGHGYLTPSTNTHPLINLLLDIGGLGNKQQGSELLWEIRRLNLNSQTDVSMEASAGLRVARLILTCCWSSMLSVLATPLTMKTPRGRRRQQQLRDTVACSLQGLQDAVKLCSLLGTQDRCDLILEQLCNASCASLTRRSLLPSREGPPRLTTSAALSLELVLQQGVELGSHCPACWPHVLRTVRAVTKLERAAFHSREVNVSPLGQEQPPEDDEVDVYSFLRSSNGELLVTKYLKSIGYVDLLSPAQTANVLTLLSYMCVELVIDAAYKLNLLALEQFARALCAASRVQLFPPPLKHNNLPANWIYKLLPTTQQQHGQGEPYLLDSVGELMVKSTRCGRPLSHMMRLWSVVGPHLTEASCHSDPVVAKKAVELIETCIDTHIKQQSELPYFHFHEALFKPFENLLCLELCEGDIQDQVVGSICEFVEGSAMDVRSGWRALFGALRSVPTSDVFLDVFRLFLETKNPLIFCSAAVDCILCLLKHVRSPIRERRQACLEFLQKCEDVLSAIWAMPQSLIFQAAHRIHISDDLLVEPDTVTPRVIPFENIPHDILKLPSYPDLVISSEDVSFKLENLDRTSGVLRVWFLLLEGLYSAAISADAEAQPSLLDAVFGDVLGLTQRKEPEFGIFCINHILLPATQSWIRLWVVEGDRDMSGPKQALGLLSELTINCMRQLQQEKHMQCELDLMLKQLMIILVECTAYQGISSTPPSCFRHISTNVGELMSPSQWNITLSALRKSFEVTLVPIRQLLMAFAEDSSSYYGDYDQIKVAARKDSSWRDVVQMKQLAQQVFLLEEQREELTTGDLASEKIGERTYTFLLRTALDSTSPHDVRLPVSNVVSSLLTHQSLLQVVAAVLLDGSRLTVPSLKNIVNGAKDETKSLPGHLDLLATEDILLLFDCLDISYQASLQFDSRPGLKFLLQKVVGLERAANLYRQAGAAWAVKVVVQFHMCLHLMKKSQVTPEDVKNTENIHDPDLIIFITRLQENFEELCEKYIKIVLDQDGGHSGADKRPEQPILFLNTCEDEEIGHIRPRYSESDVFEPEPNKLKPFMFSDFVDTVSASSTSDSEPEFAEEEEAEDLNKNVFVEEDESSVSNLGPTENLNSVELDKKENISVSKDFSNDEVDGANELVEAKELECTTFEEQTEKAQRESSTSFESAVSLLKSPEETELETPEKANETAQGSENCPPLEEDTKPMDDEAAAAALQEYKKRKDAHTKDLKSSTTSDQLEVPVQAAVPPEIEVQRRNSFLKDNEAHRRVWTEMVDGVLHLLSQLTDAEFRLMLPVLFGGIRSLTAHASDPILKQSVAEVFARVALLYGFGPPP